MTTIREQLAPHIEEAGLRETSRQSGVDPAVLSQWLNQRKPSGSTIARRLHDENIEKVCEALGLEIVIRPKGRRRKAD